ncbi:molybdopterin-dependent oxidoreductase [Micromonospora peucetia]|uniref:Molybdopterin-dependent oxidoreductase n=1 Tax=Micromonospora peucetia TaxID=47871 RepID=A0A1C6W0K9_9ACTN|nr:molybdopterin-dependent oxidoreductase [Micromonospora peucetia]WSA31761.1 molybdopterin-dependent oxidoreductase [Micromonospora peucetia]SCL71944.1 sulfoxide reductase catalytic subunit YedY [Micromonospora peucetia]
MGTDSATPAGNPSDRPTRAGTTQRPAPGFPRRWWRFLAAHPPPGLARIADRWRSPLRGPWLTAVFGVVLLATLPLVIITGLLDYLAYGPQFGQALPRDVGWLRLPQFDWPTRPAWLFRLTQGLHVTLGIVLIPVVLAKLWSVIPKLFDWPPARSVAQVLERLSLLLLVGGILFQIATGLLDIQYAYLFGFDFYTAHYFGAWVFTAALVAHVALKLPRMLSALRSGPPRAALTTPRAATRPEPPDPDGLVASHPGPATVSRRGALALVGGLSLLLGALTVGQSLDGVWRRTALLLPRGRQPGEGPNGFPVNRTAAAAGVGAADAGPGWRVTLRAGERVVALDRAALLAMAQHTARLPIACVEGWSTVQTWTGVRLSDLAALVGAGTPASAHVRSLEKSGLFNQATLQANQVLDPDSLLALGVNGADLSLDHGYPARIIVPALPGVHCTKWVGEIEFRTRTDG